MSLDKNLNPEQKPKKQSDTEKFYDLIKLVDRIGIDELIEWIEQSDFFKAPASTKFHGNFEGGLLKHCLKVYEIFRNLVIDHRLKLGDDSIIICSLFHDLNKVNTYLPKFNKNGSRSKTPYETVDSIPLGHGPKSIWAIQRFMRLSIEESMIILWHMGPFDRNFSTWDAKITKTFPLAKIFFCADYLASIFEGMGK